MRQIAFLSFAVAVLLAAPAAAQEQPGNASMTTQEPTHFDVSPPLRDIFPIPPVLEANRLVPEFEPPEGTYNLHIDVLQPSAPTPHIVQTWYGSGPMPALDTNFEGVGEGISGYTVQVAPPDTQGDVGPNYYVQWVNLDFAIFDKSSGALVYGPAAGKTLWSDFGGICESRNDGDPIVKYDQLADRWVMTQFAIDQSADEYAQCIAVSQTHDPLGSWYRYSYSFDNLNDYPKLAVWPDGYYISYNMFSKSGGGYSWAGAVMCAYDRAAMLNGWPASSQCTWPNPSFFSYLPSDLDGLTNPPAGANNYVMALGTNDQLLFWNLHIDWGDPGNSFITDPPTPISVASFTEECQAYYRNACIPQGGSTTKLESLGDRPMFRLPYRNFGDHESLVLSHSIETDGEISGIRWYEIRNPGGTPTIYQSGTYAPDSRYRWMGSMAMDRVGNMAVGYSVSDSSIDPSIWYTGRLVTDPLNELGQSEEVIQNGTGSQTGGLQRWGDYSSMSVDPVDDCTFWYTQEYLTTDGSFNWHTRIASFAYPSCFCAALAPTELTAEVSGNNAIQVDWSAADGATEYRVYRSTTSGTGYSLVETTTETSYLDASSVHGGITYYYVVTTYDDSLACESEYSSEVSATATGPCGLAPTFSGISSATSDGDCAIDLSWSAATANCGGPVTYSIYRSTDSGFAPSLANRIAAGLGGTSYTDGSGLSGGTTYFYVVRATDQSNGQEDTNTVERSGEPTGPGVPTALYGPEDFESHDPGSLADWSRGAFSGSSWNWQGVQTCGAHSGSKIFRFGGPSCSENYGADNHAVAFPPAVAVPAGSQNTRLSFFHRWDFQNNVDGAYLRVSFNGLTWSYVDGSAILQGGYTQSASPVPAWWNGSTAFFTHTEVDLDAVCNSMSGASDGCQDRTIYVGFVAYTNSSRNFDGWFIDDVTISTDVPGPCVSTPGAVDYLTALSTSNQVQLEWLNPSGTFASTRICRDEAAFPNDPETCTAVANVGGSAGQYGTYTDTTVTNGTKYYYTAFANNGSDVFSGGRSVSARPFDTTGSVKWAYATGATALAPAGIIRGDRYLVVSNDRILHGIEAGPDGGTRPSGWTPAAMNAPAQGRPTVIDFGSPTVPDASGASKVAFVGSQDGRVYAFDADTGAELWASEVLGTAIQASPGGVFQIYGATFDLVLVGTRSSTGASKFYGLDLLDGAEAWRFDNGGESVPANAIGIISGQAWIDHSNSRIYFTSRDKGSGSDQTVWCIEFTASSATFRWSAAVGDIDAAPTLWNGVLYVGDTSGTVHAFDADSTGSNASPLWSYASGDGAVKGHVWVNTQAGGDVLYFSTNSMVHARTAANEPVSGWLPPTVPGASPPFVIGGNLYVGTSNGNGSLLRLDKIDGVQLGSVGLGDPAVPKSVGAGTYDSVNNLIIVGCGTGEVFAVEADF